jgi:predicted nucleic acid-binding protein
VIRFLDANVLLGYLTDDPPDMAARAEALLEGADELTVSPLILAEVGYVLTRVYKRDRPAVVAALIDLVQRQNIRVYHVSREVAVEALQRCAPSGAVSFADALLWAEARSAGGSVHTFDEAFPQHGVPIVRP